MIFLIKVFKQLQQQKIQNKNNIIFKEIIIIKKKSFKFFFLK